MLGQVQVLVEGDDDVSGYIKRRGVYHGTNSPDIVVREWRRIVASRIQNFDLQAS